MRFFKKKQKQLTGEVEMPISTLHFWDTDRWVQKIDYAPRRMDSLILPKDDLLKVMMDLKWFFDNQLLYQRLGIPFKRSYLLYGPPGTGKTSFISMIMGILGLPLYVLNIPEMTDKSLVIALANVPARGCVVFEDIDYLCPVRTVASQEKQTDDNTVTMVKETDKLKLTVTGFLNAIDGFRAPQNILYMMTTTQPEKLDWAMARPGRIDYKMEFKRAGLEDKLIMFRRFYPDRSEQDGIEFIMINKGATTMAEFISALMMDGRTQVKQQAVIPNYQIQNSTPRMMN